MKAKYSFSEFVTTRQAKEIKESIFRFPNGSATYPAPKLASFDRYDVDALTGLTVGKVTVGSKTFEITVEKTPGASRAAFGMAEFSVALKEV